MFEKCACICSVYGKQLNIFRAFERHLTPSISAENKLLLFNFCIVRILKVGYFINEMVWDGTRSNFSDALNQFSFFFFFYEWNVWTIFIPEIQLSILLNIFHIVDTVSDWFDWLFFFVIVMNQKDTEIISRRGYVNVCM